MLHQIGQMAHPIADGDEKVIVKNKGQHPVWLGHGGVRPDDDGAVKVGPRRQRTITAPQLGLFAVSGAADSIPLHVEAA